MEITAKLKKSDNGRSERNGKLRLLLYASSVLCLVCYHLLLSPFNLSDGYNYWLDSDSGLLTETGYRILQGERLYRDIWSVYGPAADHFVASIYWLMGTNLLSLRFVLALSGAVVVLLAFFLTRKLLPTRYALAVALVACLMGPVCVNFPYPSWFCIPLGLAAVLLEHEGWKRNRNTLHFLAGALAGSAFLLKANCGVFTFFALLNVQILGVFLVPKTAPRSAIAEKADFAVATTILLALPATSLMLVKDHLTAGNMLLFFIPTLTVPVVALFVREGNQERGSSASLFAPLLSSSFGFVGTTLPMIGYYFLTLGPEMFYKAMIYPATVFARIAYFPFTPLSSPVVVTLACLFVFQGILILLRERVPSWVRSAFVGFFWIFLLVLAYQFILFFKKQVFASMIGHWTSQVWPFRLACYLPAFAHLGLAPVFIKDTRMPVLQERSRIHLALSLWVYSLANFLAFYPVMDMYHLLWVITPTLIILAYFLFRSLEFWETQSTHFFGATSRRFFRRFAVVFLPIFFGLFLALPFFRYFITIGTQPFQISLSKFSDIGSSRGGILMPAQKAGDLSAVVRAIESNSAKDDFLFDMTGSYFNFIADRKTPVYGRINFFPGILTPEDIEEARIRLLLLSPKVVISSTEGDRVYSCFYPEIYQIIRSRYHVIGSYGPFKVRKLRG